MNFPHVDGSDYNDHWVDGGEFDVPMHLLTGDLWFPPAEHASEHGIVALGGDLSAERLVLAYSQGIFPWPHPGLPLPWFSPDPRFVIDLNQVHISRSLRKVVRRGAFQVRADSDFLGVLRGCESSPRPGQDGTWITQEVIDGFFALHERGLAHSIETYQDDALVGGLYGISLGRSFCGESMFAEVPDASKVATVTLLGNLKAWGFRFLDCQVYTDHLARFGAQEWPRSRFLQELREAVGQPTIAGPWRLPLDPQAALEVLTR